MISAVCWVPKGASKPVPETAKPPSKEEIEGIVKNVILDRSVDNDKEEDEAMEVESSKPTDEIACALAIADAIGKKDGNIDSGNNFDDVAKGLKELDMDHYDDDDDGAELFSSKVGEVYYPSNDMDPYLKTNDDDNDEDDEIEDLTIQPTDAVIICARNEDDVSLLEVWIYEDTEDQESNMYVHHDIILPAFPLCMAWLDCNLNGGDKGNFIAVGSMEPVIEIWDLDLLDEIQPFIMLGGVSNKKKSKKSTVKYKKDSHKDSVLGLAWNKEVRNVLASASADHTVKIWDVASGKCAVTLQHHSDKVQSVAWNRHVPEVLLSGSFDHSVVMVDMRSPSHDGIKWSVPADVESLQWNPHDQHYYVVSLEDGTIQGFDIRTAASDSTAKPSFILHAHDKAVCSVSFSPAAPNLIATGSTDKMVKLWDLSNNQPTCLTSRNPKAGSIFSVSFSDDSPFLLAIGGSKGKLQVWDTLSDAGIANKYGNEKSRKIGLEAIEED